MADAPRDQSGRDALRATDLAILKKRLSPGLLNIAGVSGVGISGGTLAVYLEIDSDALRHAVETVVAREAAGVPVTYVVAGKFRAH